MTRLSKLRRDHLSAELAAIQAMIAELTDDDLITRSSLEQRVEEIAEEISEQQKSVLSLESHFASAELIFAGRPVIASQGIESEFGGKAVTRFQDLVAKQYVLETGGNLATRGVVANKGAARLYISEVIRGSFGFRFEELGEQYQLDSTSLKKAVDHAVGIIDAFAHLEGDQFNEIIETTDQRIVSSAEQFFELMHDEQATFRAITDDLDRNFDEPAIVIALERAKTTEIEDEPEMMVGTLLGILPESHQFEFAVEHPHRVIRGKVDRRLSAEQLGYYLRDFLEKPSIATLNVRRIIRRGALVRESFTLNSLEPSAARD